MKAVLDSTSYRSHGASSGMTVGAFNSYPVGRAMVFDGSNDYISFADLPVVAGTNFTCEGSFKFTFAGSDSGHCIIGNLYPGTTSKVEYALAFDSTNSYKMWAGYYNTAWYKISSAAAVNDGAFKFVAGVRSGTT